MMRVLNIANFESEYYGTSGIDITAINEAFMKRLNEYTVPQVASNSVCDDLKADYEQALEDCREDLDGNLSMTLVATYMSGPWAPLTGATGLTYNLYTWDQCKGRALRDYKKDLKRAGCL